MAGSTIGFAGMRAETMTVLCLLLFVGAMGKSAQLGLHTWLPDAMEGPTPVSALIHAATMVTAGVFMVCRLSPMFEVSETARHAVTYVGAATCIFAATVGCAQNDIKRVIAYSTCSQLGYMFFAAGVGAYGAAMFHLFTHAFFKALLFLGAGSVIHAMPMSRTCVTMARSEGDPDHLLDDDRRNVGDYRRRPVRGRFRRLPFQDAIIESAFASGVHGTVAYWLGVLPPC
jgi:NADH-quinone oxidoreductase subunit L